MRGGEQLDLLGDGPFPPYQKHSDTSLAAATKIQGRTGPLHRSLLRALRIEPSLTDEQMQDGCAMGPSTQRPRRVELVRAGLVADSGHRAKTRSGRMAVLWELTPAGRVRAATLGDPSSHLSPSAQEIMGAIE